MTKQEIQSKLPDMFECDCNAKTHAIYIHADLKDIGIDGAKKHVDKLLKEFKLKIVTFRCDDETADWCLYEKAFEKQMVVDAKTALKSLKNFFSKYNDAYRYSDDTCEIVRDIIDIIDNS